MLMDFVLQSHNHRDLPPTPCTFSHLTCTFSSPFFSLQFQVFLKELADIIQKDIRYFDIRHVANIVHALAKLGERNASIFSAVESNASWIVENGDAQNIANVAWACAKLNVRSPSLFRSIDDNAFKLVKTGTPQAVETTAWAFAKLDIHAPFLFRSIERSTWLIENGNLQAIAVTRQAFTQLAPSKGRGGGERSKKYRAIELNKRIGELGGDWNGLLDLHQREGEGFDSVNWATATSKLGRLRMRAMREMKRDARVSRRCIHCCLSDWD